MNLTGLLFAGVLASMLHVISGPDHLAAVTPLVIESEKKAWKIGLSWGFGHLAGMLIIGVLFLIFKDYIPIESISQYSEQFVGIVLIGVGVWAFYKIFKVEKTHKHIHVHAEDKPFIHSHKHDHNHLEKHKHTHTKVIQQNIISSFGIGIIHGLAGVAHFLLLLPVLSFNSTFESVQYILGFGIGTVLAMTAYAFILEKLTGISKQVHNDSFFTGIRFAGGLFAIVIGVYWLYLGF